MRNRRISAFVLAVALLGGCAGTPYSVPPSGASSAIADSPWATIGSVTPDSPHAPRSSTLNAAPWQHYPLPGKRVTQFAPQRKDGRDTMAATANQSASMLRQTVRIEPQDLAQVRFSWLVPALIANSDLAHRDRDDSPVRIVFAFEGDRAKFSAKNSMLSELARAVTGEELPYATLMYVWCNSRQPDDVIVSSRTDRIRKLVVESGAGRLNQWLDYERDIRADFERAFGEPPGALVGVAIMTDSDNTRSKAQAWYGPLRLQAHNRVNPTTPHGRRDE